MQANVAVYTFAISVFVAFLLWSSKNLGIIGLLGAFSVGLISYSMDSSIETAVASIVIAGVLIKFILPSIQAKWIEKYADYSAPAIEQQIHSAERTRERIEAMQKGDKTVEGYRGLAPQLLEGFATGSAANASQQISGNVMAAAGGQPAVLTQMQNASAMQQPATGTTINIPGQGTANVGATNTTFTPTPNTPLQQGLAATVAQSAPPAVIPTTTSSMLPVIPTTTSSMLPVISTTTSSMPPVIPTTTSSATFSMSPTPPAGPTQPGGIANLSGLSTNNTPDLTGAATGNVNTAMPGVSNAAAAPATGTMMGGTGTGTGMAGFRNIEQFAEQPQAVPGMFKLGELPSESKNGPHIDAGTTIMRALGALNPDQISSLTDDTRKLLDTQKSLMGMLSTMKPMLSDGQNLLASFTNMFGKQN